MSSIKSKSIDMTEGVIWKQLFNFSISLLIGDLLQVLYNTVDSIVVGNFIGPQAVAAVGSSTNYINMLVGFFNGMSVGATVIIAQYFGAKDDENLHDAVHTTIAFTMIGGVFLSLLGIMITPPLLKAVSTPADVLPEAAAYLKIYFAGMWGLVLYNMGAGILRAVGDSQRPLYCLIFSTLLNIVLDLLFVIHFDMGVTGVALATIFSQFISAALILILLVRAENSYRFIIKDLKIQPEMLRQILHVGLPAAIQRSITNLSNVLIQSYINFFGSSCMAGWAIYIRLNQFITLPLQSMGTSVTTFVGQNLGAGKTERAETGTRTALKLTFAVTVILVIVLNIFCRQIIRLFGNDLDMMEYGEMFIRTLTFFHPIHCIVNVYAGALRGAGDSRAAMFFMVGCYVGVRQLYLALITPFVNTPASVGLAYPASWTACALLIYLYYKAGRWKKHCSVTAIIEKEN